MKYAKGIMWLDDCRIPFVDEGDLKSQERAFTEGSSSHKGQAWNNHLGWEGSKGAANPTDIKGRFTPNLLVCDDMLNDGVITSQSSGLRKNPGIKTQEWKAGHKKKDIMTTGDKGTNSRYYDLDTWFNKIIDEIR